MMVMIKIYNKMFNIKKTEIKIKKKFKRKF